jgi:hypothetical protein
MFCDDCCLLLNNVHMSREGTNAKVGNLGDAHNPGESGRGGKPYGTGQQWHGTGLVGHSCPCKQQCPK